MQLFLALKKKIVEMNVGEAVNIIICSSKKRFRLNEDAKITFYGHLIRIKTKLLTKKNI